MRRVAKYEQIHKGSDSSFRYGWTVQFYQDEIPLHFHPEIEIISILKGAGYRMTGDFLEPFDSGEVIFVPSNIPHCWIYNPESCMPDGNRECIYIQFSPSFLEKGMAFFPEWKYIVHKLASIRQVMRIEGEAAELMRSMMKSMADRDTSGKLLVLMQIVQLIGTTSSVRAVDVQRNISSDITRNMHRMQVVLRYILENYRNRIRLPEVASLLNMTDTAFCAFFKRETGKNFVPFVNEYRLESACSMLKSYPDIAVKEIALECGFIDIPYFNRYFKRMKKMTPRQWRSHL